MSPCHPEEPRPAMRRGVRNLVWSVALASAVPGFADSPRPFPWPNGAKAAVVLTYDDGMDTHLDSAAPDLEAARASIPCSSRAGRRRT
jgi:hypothetical protein